ncbi:hypothetical protein CXB51_025222 [Gossypium anomalum]|uniref:Polygalacturonase n=1 Tax=Gossypium anomalum TaxID=47600 RepID=A0A8J6CSE0_9ROSI|nr:hypothetical protein CXB51_025222 [Gossypium anomalum]
MLSVCSTFAMTEFNVLNFGANLNGRTDSTNSFLKAWNSACGTADLTFIYVPKGRYLVGSLAFKGQCKSPQIIIRIDGTIVAPLDYGVLGKSDNCSALKVDVGQNWPVIEQVTCGPGHGISIGSLAKDLKEEGVQNVTVKNTIFSNTQNGLRIKSWAKRSSGYVQGVQFLGSVMTNVQNPIVIDQNYCPRNENCSGQISGIKIKDIVYEDIRGTSSTPIAIKFDCSSKNLCTGIRLQNVNLTYLNKAAQSFCSNVVGKTFDLVRPNSCL